LIRGIKISDLCRIGKIFLPTKQERMDLPGLPLNSFPDLPLAGFRDISKIPSKIWRDENS